MPKREISVEDKPIDPLYHTENHAWENVIQSRKNGCS